MADLNGTDLKLGLPESGFSGGPYREINFFSVDDRGKSEDVEMGDNRRIVHAVCTMDQIAKDPCMGDEVSACGSNVVGWPPVNLYRRNNNTSPKARQHEGDCRNVGKHQSSSSSSSSSRIKVMMDEAPYMRKVDLKNITNGYEELCTELENLFECFMRSRIKEADPIILMKRLQFLHGREYVLTYEDDEGDWMLAGDMPWKSFTESVKRIRIMKRHAILHG